MENERKIISIILNNHEMFTVLKDYKIIFHDKCCKYIYDVIQFIIDKHGKWNDRAVLDYIIEKKDFNLVDYYDVKDLQEDKENFNFYLNDLLVRQLNIDLQSYIMQKQDKNFYNYKNDIFDICNKNKDIELKAIENNKQLCRKLVEKLKIDYTLERVYSGIEFFEKKQSGYEKDTFILIGAAESVGKTSFMLDIIIKQLKENMAIGLISCEMKREKIFQLIACNLAGIDSNKVDNHLLDNKEAQMFIDANEKLYEKELYIIDDTRDWNTIKNKINILVKEKKVNMIYIDYMHYLRVKDIQKQYDRLEIISGDTKDLCKNLNIPICMIVALNRQGKQEEPQTFHIKGNGDIEYDADIVLLMQIQKEEIFDEKLRTIKFFVRKNRNGCQGFWFMNFYCDIRRFEKIYFDMSKK